MVSLHSLRSLLAGFISKVQHFTVSAQALCEALEKSLNCAGEDGASTTEQVQQSTGTSHDGIEAKHTKLQRQIITDQWAYKRSLELWPSPM